MNFLSTIKAEGGIQLLNASGGAFSAFSNAATASRTWTMPNFDCLVGRNNSFYVSQTAHGLSVGNAIYKNGSNYAKAKADALATLSPGLIVSAVIDSNSFVATSGGYISGLSGLTQGSFYYVSETTSGELTTTEPNGNYWSNPVLYAISSTEGIVQNVRAERSKIITSYTPAITAGSGTFTTVSATGYFHNIDNYKAHVIVFVDITTAGSAATYIQATLPFTAANTHRHAGWGAEVSSLHRAQKVEIPTSNLSVVRDYRYDGATQIGSGNKVIIEIIATRES